MKTINFLLNFNKEYNTNASNTYIMRQFTSPLLIIACMK